MLKFECYLKKCELKRAKAGAMRAMGGMKYLWWLSCWHVTGWGQILST